MSKPKFKIGDKLQSGGTPSDLIQIINVQTNADGSGSFYGVESPEGNTSMRRVEDVDPYFRKNAREFNRRFDEVNAPPRDPMFDDDGQPNELYYIDEDRRLGNV